MTVDGGGTFYMYGTNTYTGNTVVNNGAALTVGTDSNSLPGCNTPGKIFVNGNSSLYFPLVGILGSQSNSWAANGGAAMHTAAANISWGPNSIYGIDTGSQWADGTTGNTLTTYTFPFDPSVGDRCFDYRACQARRRHDDH